MLPTTTDGAFMPTIDWTNPDFSPYDLRNLVLRSAQRKELLREDIDVSKKKRKLRVDFIVWYRL